MLTLYSRYKSLYLLCIIVGACGCGCGTGCGDGASSDLFSGNSVVDKEAEQAALEAQTGVSESRGMVKYYHGQRYYYNSSNHVIVSTSYDRPVVQNIIGLSNELDWNVFYVQTADGLKGYSTQYVTEDNTTCGYHECVRCGIANVIICDPCACPGACNYRQE